MVSTEFVLVTDDDYFLKQTSNLRLALALIQSGDADIVGPAQAFNFTIRDDALYIFRVPMRNNRWIRCDVVSNCFLARTEALRRVPWRNALKINEHAAFFLDAKRNGLTVVASVEFGFVHAHHWGGALYKRMRRRNFLHLYRRLFGVRNVVWHRPPGDALKPP
jgi:hypothetical protein